jgi:hypothetical protein
MQTNDKVLLGLLLFFFGLVLLQKPNCRRGCRTLAEHLLTDGLEGVISALFA